MLNSKSNVRNIGDILDLRSDFTFLNPPLISAPHTDITDLLGSTRQVPDYANMLRPVLGLERIEAFSPVALRNEKGPNGKAVYAQQDLDPRIRFVGIWTQESDAFGPTVISPIVDSYVEVIFYGTGLNFLTLLDATSRDIRVTIDNGVESADVYTEVSSILNNRGYRTNHRITIASNLTLGLHRAKIRLVSGANIRYYGVEILNQATQLKVPQGEVTSPRKFVNSALQSIDYNTGFDGNPVLNGRGGRVVIYQKANGLVGKALQQTESSQLNLTFANHSNEALIEKINFRMGAARADDFTTMTTTPSNRGYTLPDNSTTLTGDSVATDTDFTPQFNGFYPSPAGSHFIFTFTGTGLDLACFREVAITDTYRIYIDGTEITSGATSGGTLFSVASPGAGIVKIVSGLPYCSHTCKVERVSGAGTGATFTDFLVYAPKEPTIPANAKKVGEYYLVANYDGTTATTGTNSTNNMQIPRGVIHKLNTREVTYSGSWTVGTFDATYPSGFFIFSTTNGNYEEFQFWGTGINVHHSTSSGGTVTFTATIDGALNATGVNRVNMSNGGGGTYSTTSTAVGAPARLEFTGLSLGWHTIRLTRSGGAGNFGTFAWDVITPIHFQDSSLGSMSVGSFLPIKSEIEDLGVDLTKAKAWLVYDKANSIIRKSHNIAAVLSTGTGAFRVFFEKPFKSKDYVFAGNVTKVSGTDTLILVGVDEDSAYRSNSSTAFEIRNTGALFQDRVVTIAFFGELDEE